MKQRITTLVNNITKEKGWARIGLLGYGKTTAAILDILAALSDRARITVYHKEELLLPHPVRCEIYRGAKDRISCDLLFVSPSVRREELNLEADTLITSDTELLLEENGNNRFLITGSDGKSTVSAMTAALLGKRFPDIFLGGNIGTPVALCELSRTDAFVIELSSFNLRYITPASSRAMITNITPNHLNWHASYGEYAAAKENILLRSKEPIINVDTPECARIAKGRSLYAVCSSRCSAKELKELYSAEHFFTVSGEKLTVDGDPLMELDLLSCSERHNIENFLSAAALTHGYVDTDQLMHVAREFRGLPHRCERFFESEGISFIDSSIDTTPERTRATLTSLKKRVRIILGGKGKGLSLEPIREPLLRYADRISIYGDIREELEEFINSDVQLNAIPHLSFVSFTEAAEHATENMKAGDTVLLSPAATSYGEFASFEERGELFKSFIRNKYSKI